MQILITNYVLQGRTGTELYVRDLARELLRRGHQPLIYTPRPGITSQELEQAGIPVATNLAQADFKPGIIHGHHWHETMTAVLRFPDVPAISFCHDISIWFDRAPFHPNIRRYLAVSLACRERLLKQGIDPSRVQIILNFVDLGRFKQRTPLPERPRRALLFSNSTEHVSAVTEACRLAGLRLDVVGSGVGCSVERPEDILGDYDLVFAKGRAAIEAMAVGTAVLLCDRWGCGTMVSTAQFDQFRQFNFGLTLLSGPLEPQYILEQIGRYDPGEAQEVCRRIRSSAGLDRAVGQLEQVYHEVIDEYRSRKPSVQEQGRAVARYLNEYNSQLAELEELRRQVRQLTADKPELAAALARLSELENCLPVRMKESLVRVPILGGMIRTAGRCIRKIKDRRPENQSSRRPANGA